MKKNKNRAFTIIELLIAAIIISLAIVPIFQVLISQMITNSDLNRRTIALQLARERMEHVNMIPWSDLSNQVLFEAPGFRPSDPLFSRSTTIDASSLKLVTVIVSWEVGTSTGNVILQTYRTSFE